MTEHPDDLVHDRRTYRPGPCRKCGSPVSVAGFYDVSTGSEAAYIPKRVCVNAACPTRAGRLSDPRP